MAWFAVATGRSEWMVVDPTREPEERIVGSGMSWVDAEALCEFHGKHRGEYEDIASAIEGREPF